MVHASNTITVTHGLWSSRSQNTSLSGTLKSGDPGAENVTFAVVCGSALCKAFEGSFMFPGQVVHRFAVVCVFALCKAVQGGLMPLQPPTLPLPPSLVRLPDTTFAIVVTVCLKLVGRRTSNAFSIDCICSDVVSGPHMHSSLAAAVRQL